MSKEKPITVTQPTLPPLEEYVELLRDIWSRKWLTNNGHYHKELEQALADCLGVKYVSLFCNGMIALQVGLQALEIDGEVITTPFSFPATTHALWWSHCTPVFGDIHPATCNIDPAMIESVITPRTSAILPVHVYGTPCDVDAIQRIADTYGLKVFYDAAHAFGVRLNGRSILTHGDLSMLSFHATKVFSTAEGGALVTNDPKLKERIDYLKNFGFAGETTVIAPGTNGKMNELQAALGLVNLKHVPESIDRRLNIDRLYRELLEDVPGIRLLATPKNVQRNGAYFPVFVDKERYGMSRDELYEHLKAQGIYGRRYFYPLISTYPMYRELPTAQSSHLPVATRVADEVLCLPLYAELDVDDARSIAGVIRRV